MNIKSLLFGLLIILLVGIGGFVYRNAVEHSSRSIACPLDAKLCPDGTAVGRSGPACEFAQCPAQVQATSTPMATSTSEGGAPVLK